MHNLAYNRKVYQNASSKRGCDDSMGNTDPRDRFYNNFDPYRSDSVINRGMKRKYRIIFSLVGGFILLALCSFLMMITQAMAA